MDRKIGIGIFSGIISSALTNFIRIKLLVPMSEVIEMNGLAGFIVALISIWLFCFVPLFWVINQAFERSAPKQCKTEIKTKEVPSPTRFHANDTITASLHHLYQQLEKTKRWASLEVEMRHELEKIERQLEESKVLYMSVNEKHQKEADKMLTSILSKMEERMQSILDERDQQQLVALEKILIQQQ